MWTCGLAAISLFGCVIIATGAPFERTVSFTQPNGTAIELWGKGDEFQAVFETLDGYTVVYAPESKAYYYAALSADGTDLIPTAWQAGTTDPAALGLAKHLRKSAARASAEARARYERWDTAVRLRDRWAQRKDAARAAEDGRVPMAPPAYTTTGTKVGLCLLIDFSDEPATVPQAQIMDFCNGDAYTGFGNNGSVKKYYQDVSNGLLTYTNIVTAYIRMEHPKTYYDDTSKDNGLQGNILIRDAITILKAQPNYASQIAPAFANLTVDGEGRAVACNVFFAGADSGVWSYGLWPHSWSLWEVDPQELTADIAIWNYQITNIGESLELGTFCHENGHMLCDYPDIYDYDIDPETDYYDSVGGAGVFCLMNSGGHGVNPVQVCAYLKRASGWATTLDLTASSDLTASLSASGAGLNTFYRYAKPGVPTEYYLIENRQAVGRDASLPASGIAVWHIDELGDRDNQSLAYNTAHENYECTLMQADGLWDFQLNVNSGDDGDLFHSDNPADGYQNVFNDGTLPGARWWDGSDSGLNLFAFSASGNVMTFEVQPPTLMITTASPLPDGAVETPYSRTLTAFGGQPPYTWSLTDGALPAGLSLSSEGVISGTPTGAGTFFFDVQVEDATNGTASATFSLTVQTAFLLPFAEGFENDGSMPAGWTQAIQSGDYEWYVYDYGPNNHPSGAFEGSYYACFLHEEFDEVETWLVSPPLDRGNDPDEVHLSFWHYMAAWEDDLDELHVYYKGISETEWTLLAVYDAETPTWTRRLVTLPTDNRLFQIAFGGVSRYGYGVCIDQVDITTDPMPPMITTAALLPPGTVGVAYSHTFEATEGAAPYAWTLVDGVLPDGLSFSGSGVLSGTPSEEADVELAISVTGADGLASTNLFTLAVLPLQTLPYFESYENSGNLPIAWTQEYVSGAVNWNALVASPDGYPDAAWDGDYLACFYSGQIGSVTRLVSPLIDLGPAPQNPVLAFMHCMKAYDAGEDGIWQDELRVYVRVPGGAWSLLETFVDDTPEWTQRVIALPTSERILQIAFEGTSYYGSGVCVDQVGIIESEPSFAFWQLGWFTESEIQAGGIADEGDDPDGDGIVNLFEYAWAMDPWDPDTTGRPGGGVSGGQLTLTFRESKQAGDLFFLPVACTDLTLGDWDSSDITEVSRADSNMWWQVTVRHDVPVSNAPARFMRLELLPPLR